MKNQVRAVVLVVLLLFFLLAVVACAFFVIKLDRKEKEIQNIQESLEQIEEELKTKNEEIKSEEKKEENDNVTQKEEVTVDVDMLNKEHCQRILNIIGAGSFEGKYLAIMGKESSAENLQNLYTNSFDYSRDNFAFKVIDASYSEYEKEWQSFISKSLLEDIVRYKSVITYDNAIINVDGKVGINVGTGSGSQLLYDSQKLISKDGNNYTYELKYKRYEFTSKKYTEMNAVVVGKIEGENYIIEKFETK